MPWHSGRGGLPLVYLCGIFVLSQDFIVKAKKDVLTLLKRLRPLCVLAAMARVDSGPASATGYLFRTLLPGPAVSASCPAGQFQQSSPGTYSVTVPANCAVSFTLNGAGGGGALGLGGSGAQVTGDLPTSSAVQQYSVVLQAGGSAGSDNTYSPVATGGGYAAIYAPSGTLIAIAGGGGGAGGYGGSQAEQANGGDAGMAGGEDSYSYCDVGAGISG